jgi:KDO2-lipid IV(A) lauroyltransferase
VNAPAASPKKDPDAAARRRRRRRAFRRTLASVPQNLFLWLGSLVVPMLSRAGEKRLAGFIARTFCRPGSRFHRYATTNIEFVYGGKKTPEEKARIVRSSFANAALVLTDYFWFARRTEERLERHCEIGDDTMRRWIEGDFPGVFVTAHLGNWELSGLYIASLGRRLWSVFKPIGSRAVARRMRRFRSGFEQRVIPREGAMVGVMRALRARDVVALLLDQHVDGRDGGVYHDFLGLPASFSPAVGTLAHRLRVPVLVAAGVRDEARDKVVLRSVREFTVEETAAMEPDALTRAIADAIAEMVLRWPDQWLWQYRRWKRWQPGDDPKRFPWYAKEDPLATPFAPPKPPEASAP